MAKLIDRENDEHWVLASTLLLATVYSTEFFFRYELPLTRVATKSMVEEKSTKNGISEFIQKYILKMNKKKKLYKYIYGIIIFERNSK
jgi:hypothetical protein